MYFNRSCILLLNTKCFILLIKKTCWSKLYKLTYRVPFLVYSQSPVVPFLKHLDANSIV